jgi:hypothetical protein
MANRETYPASQSPLQGDISGPAGSSLVTVVGIQKQPVDPKIPIDKDLLRFDATVPEWTPLAEGNSSFAIGTFAQAGGVVVSKGLPISDDYEVLVNNVSLEGLVGWAFGNASQVFVNGVAV